jgi:hypothetical protein
MENKVFVELYLGLVVMSTAGHVEISHYCSNYALGYC